MSRTVQIAAKQHFTSGVRLLSQTSRQTAFSEAGKTTSLQARQAQKRFQKARTLHVDRQEGVNEVLEVFSEWLEERKIEPSIAPLTGATLRQAVTLLEALPKDIPTPEFAYEPDDGALSVEWSAGRRRLVSLSLNGSSRAVLVTLEGRSVMSGTVPLFGDQLPVSTLNRVREIFSIPLPQSR